MVSSCVLFLVMVIASSTHSVRVRTRVSVPVCFVNWWWHMSVRIPRRSGRVRAFDHMPISSFPRDRESHTPYSWVECASYAGLLEANLAGIILEREVHVYSLDETRHHSESVCPEQPSFPSCILKGPVIMMVSVAFLFLPSEMCCVCEMHLM